MIPILAIAALGLTAGTSRDTVFDVRRGDRIVIESLSGEVAVRAWDQDRVEISEDRSGSVRAERTGSTVRIGSADGRRGRRSVEASIRVPAWIDVEIGGPSVDASVVGVHGRVSVSNVSGDVSVEGSAGEVRVRTIEGEVRITDATGDVSASSQSGDVVLSGISGAVSAHSGSGDIVMDAMTSGSVRAETQDGDVHFRGDLVTEGTYGFFVHDGDAFLELPAETGASVSVSTFDGEFESEFPVTVQRFTGGKAFDFVLGDGSARVRIEVFDGEIRLLRRRGGGEDR